MKTSYRKNVYAGLVFVLAVLFVAMGKTFSYAQDLEKMEKSRGKTFDSVVRGLHLTPEQQERINKQRIEQKGQAAQMKELMRSKHEALRAELEKDTTDRQKVQALVAEIQQLIGQRIQKRVDSILELKAILTPEQFRALNRKLDGIGNQRNKKGGRP